MSKTRKVKKQIYGSLWKEGLVVYERGPQEKGMQYSHIAESPFVSKLYSEHGGNPVVITCPCCGSKSRSTDWAYAGTGKRCEACRVKLAGKSATFLREEFKDQPLELTVVKWHDEDNPFQSGFISVAMNYYPLDKLKPIEEARTGKMVIVIESGRPHVRFLHGALSSQGRAIREGRVMQVPPIEELILRYENR